MTDYIDPMIFHTHHRIGSSDIPFWMKLARRHPGPVLELGCGTGRVTVELSQAGNQVVGLDLDFERLAFIQRFTTLSKEVPINIIQADFTCIPLAQKFGLVIMPCNTYSTLEKTDRLTTLFQVKQHLLPTGVFAVHLPNPSALYLLPVKSENEIEEIFTHPLSGLPIQVSSSWQRSGDKFTVNWYYDLLFSDGRVSRTTVTIVHYLESIQVYREEFYEAGLSIQNEYCDYNFTPFTMDSGDWIILASLP